MNNFIIKYGQRSQIKINKNKSQSSLSLKVDFPFEGKYKNRRYVDVSDYDLRTYLCTMNIRRIVYIDTFYFYKLHY